MSERTSFELPDFLWDALERDAESRGASKVQLLREIIDNSAIDLTRLKRSIVDFRLGEQYINDLQKLADEALPAKVKAKGRRRGNKSAVLQEILLQYYSQRPDDASTEI